jgi:DNA-binding MarR family transcriptional regulator
MCAVMSESELASGATPAPPAAAGSGQPVSPDDWRLVVWRSFLRTHNHLLRQLEQQLVEHGKLALGNYDVLVQLAEAPGNRLRMSELAEAVLLSRSGLTRLVDRLQKDGLVLRQPDPEDARGMYTVLTAKGRNTLRDASRVHLAGVSSLVLDRLSEAQLRQLEALMIQLDPAPATPPAGQQPGD